MCMDWPMRCWVGSSRWLGHLTMSGSFLSILVAESAAAPEGQGPIRKLFAAFSTIQCLIYLQRKLLSKCPDKRRTSADNRRAGGAGLHWNGTSSSFSPTWNVTWIIQIDREVEAPTKVPNRAKHAYNSIKHVAVLYGLMNLRCRQMLYFTVADPNYLVIMLRVFARDLPVPAPGEKRPGGKGRTPCSSLPAQEARYQ